MPLTRNMMEGRDKKAKLNRREYRHCIIYWSEMNKQKENRYELQFYCETQELKEGGHSKCKIYDLLQS